MSLLPNPMTSSLFGAASVRSPRRRFAPSGRGVELPKPTKACANYSIPLALTLWVGTPLLLWSGLVFLVWQLI